MVTLTQLRKVVKANNVAIQNMGSGASIRDLQRVTFQREAVYTLIKRMQAGENIQAEAARLGITEQKNSGRAQSTFTRQADVIKESAWHRRHLKSTLPLAQQGTMYRKAGEKGYNAVVTGTKAAKANPVQAYTVTERDRKQGTHTIHTRNVYGESKTFHTVQAVPTEQLQARGAALLTAAATMSTATPKQKAQHTRTVNKGNKMLALASVQAADQANCRAGRTQVIQQYHSMRTVAE